MSSRLSVKLKPHLYSNFVGVSSAKADISMEDPERQFLAHADNVFCSYRGYISNEAPIVSRFDELSPVSHVRFLSYLEDKIMYAASDAGGISLRCTNSAAKVESVFSANTPISSTVFNRKVIVVGHGAKVFSFDGYAFTPLFSRSADGAKFVCAAQNRLFFAGYNAKPNEVLSTRVNDENTFPDDEAPGEVAVTKAARLNIQNMIGGGDRIQGIGTFEANRLAIFTSDKALVYAVDPDYTTWKIDNSVAINVGTISHNSIVQVGGELFFCSRSGLHSIRRSALNGLTVFTVPLSEEITELYQSLLATVPDTQMVSCCYNQDEGRMHVFFPQSRTKCVRLSVSIAPSLQENAKIEMAWSASYSTNLSCADYAAGRVVCGSPSGLIELSGINTDSGFRGDGSFSLPVLWHKDVFNPKVSQSLILIAAGSGRVEFKATDETGRQLGTYVFDIPALDQTEYTGVPIQRQFTLPFQHKYHGVRLTCRINSDKRVRIYAIGVFTKEE